MSPIDAFFHGFTIASMVILSGWGIRAIYSSFQAGAEDPK